MTFTPEIYTRYVLGQLDEALQEQLERAMLADEEVFVSLTEAEDVLVDGFVAGTLDDGDRQAFQKRMDEVPVLAERVRFAEALRDVVRENRAGIASPHPHASIASPHPWASIAAAAAVIFLLANVWFGMEAQKAKDQVRLARQDLNEQKNRIQALEDAQKQTDQELLDARQTSRQLQEDLSAKEMELEKIKEQPDQPAIVKQPVLLSLLMATEVLRGEEPEAPVLALPDHADGVRLQLDLGGAPVAPGYRVYLTNAAGETLWSRSGLQAAKTPGANLVEVTLPAAVLRRQKGKVMVRLDEFDEGGWYTVALLPLEMRRSR